ncbi:MAG: hypothetical protein HQM08_12860 [Candidatus Riflebacteria bacterium]|nr:hypothetical protein [Candidatus Riflebacteria bacterium]
MKEIVRIFFFLLFCFFLTDPSLAWRKWEYINPSDVEISIIPKENEIVSGKEATFVIKVRNRTDKSINIDFSTGQRWDMSVFHDGTEIWRWANNLSWLESPHSIPLSPETPLTQIMKWTTIDRLGNPLPTGIYRIQGTLKCSPRPLVSNLADIRLLPPIQSEIKTIKINLFQTFEISLPRVIKSGEVIWKTEYDYNDNRIEEVSSDSTEKERIIRFKGLRTGHVTIRFYAFPQYKTIGETLERRSVRVEVE